MTLHDPRYELTRIAAGVVAAFILLGVVAYGTRAYPQVPSSSSSSSSSVATDGTCATTQDSALARLRTYGAVVKRLLTGPTAQSFIVHLGADAKLRGTPPTADAVAVVTLPAPGTEGVILFNQGCVVTVITEPASVVDQALTEATGI